MKIPNLRQQLVEILNERNSSFRSADQILFLISQDREELIVGIEKMKIKEGNPIDGYKVNMKSILGFNQALDKVLSLIKPNTPPNAGD